MSYILDALKKADSERRLGSVPNIYAAAPAQRLAAADTSVRRQWLPWLLAFSVAATAATGVAWFTLWQPSPVGTPIATATPSAPHMTTTPAAPAVTTVAPMLNPPPVEPMPTVRNDAQDMKTAQSQNSPTFSAKPAQPQTPSPALTPAIAEEKPIGRLRDLPEDVQREIPATTVNGYIYARNPADRSVLINNKLLHEGEQIEPGLLLEKLTPNGALLNFKGYRYRIPY